jgi:hypothetical protein
LKGGFATIDYNEATEHLFLPHQTVTEQDLIQDMDLKPKIVQKEPSVPRKPQNLQSLQTISSGSLFRVTPINKEASQFNSIEQCR